MPKHIHGNNHPGSQDAGKRPDKERASNVYEHESAEQMAEYTECQQCDERPIS
jgi:hypothetical protein